MWRGFLYSTEILEFFSLYYSDIGKYTTSGEHIFSIYMHRRDFVFKKWHYCIFDSATFNCRQAPLLLFHSQFTGDHNTRARAMNSKSEKKYVGRKQYASVFLSVTFLDLFSQKEHSSSILSQHLICAKTAICV